MSAMRTSLAIECAGETLHLLPERALWWPAGRVLFVADLHLGKAAAFRALGQPVPSGTTQANFDRLNRLLHEHAPERLIFLGDFLHAAEARTPAVLSELTAWRAQWSTLGCVLVRGNHDQRAGDPPAALGIEVVEEPWPLGPFAACHHPQAVPGRLVLAGHVHPAASLRGRGRDHLRLPCFALDAEKLVLPAFGEFTGGHTLVPVPGLQLFPVNDDGVWRLPVRQP
ncbi:MAG: ligase-associated DNA damage response endonuclease PdeM [Rhizobacter sp.]